MANSLFAFRLRYVVIVLIVVLLSQDAFGCRCFTPTVCQAYTRAKSVFVGKLLKVEEDEKSTIETVYAHFGVERVFKGTPGDVEVVKFVPGGCDREFNVGERYFVYNQAASIVNSVCNRTELLARAEADLRYVSNLSGRNPHFTISGIIKGLSRVDLGQTSVSVEVSGKPPVNLVNNDGFFEYVAKDAQTYRVTILFPTTRTVFVNSWGIEEKIIDKRITYSVGFQPNECDYREFTLGIEETIGP